jgi:tRNA threonylcarbamoyl adenosine modification protein (Sua5/YciO/YrdC/YwlC family)
MPSQASCTIQAYLERVEAMTQFFSIHPDNPQARLLRQAINIIQNGGLVVYPTDSGYALGCRLGDKSALEKIRRIRQLDKHHNMTLVCRDLSDLGTYAQVSNRVFRILKAFTPGPYTFVLKATSAVPRLMLHPTRKTLGLRVPDNVIALSLLEALEAPLMSTTLILPGADAPLSSPDAIRDLLGEQIDLIIDGGHCESQPTTVVELIDETPKILRTGKGDPTPFQ